MLRPYPILPVLYPLNFHTAMADANSTPNVPNPGTELAKERNRAAEERTLMAWIRTSLSLIGFGFGIDRIVAAIQQSLGDAVNPVQLTRILGLSFVALGTFAMLYAALDHREQLKRIQRNDLIYLHRHSPSLVVAYVLAVLGTVAFIGILISPLLR
jgi:putative membrane protein